MTNQMAEMGKFSCILNWCGMQRKKVKQEKHVLSAEVMEGTEWTEVSDAVFAGRVGLQDWS